MQNKLSLCFILILILLFNSAYTQQPARDWATYYGNTGTDQATINMDNSNKYLYLSGITQDVDSLNTQSIGTPGTFHPYMSYNVTGPLDGYLAKFNIAGQRIWGTYIGGAGMELYITSTVDHHGNIYVTGITNSDTSIATTGTFQNYFPYTPSSTMFISFLMKFDSMGHRVWGTYIGDSMLCATPNIGSDGISYLAADDSDNIYIYWDVRYPLKTLLLQVLFRTL